MPDRDPVVVLAHPDQQGHPAVPDLRVVPEVQAGPEEVAPEPADLPPAVAGGQAVRDNPFREQERIPVAVPAAEAHEAAPAVVRRD